MSITPVILCGGGGRRLWPLSRPDRPKPLLPIGGEPLLTATARRFSGDGFRAPWLVTGGDHADAMSALLPHAETILVEPIGRGTAAAIAASACLAARRDPEALLLVTPADHVVRAPEALRDAVRSALPAVHAGYIVTFGITPDHPATGYGWIEPGAPVDARVHTVARFIEKPAVELAQSLFQSGGMLWNAGLFLFRADTLLSEMQRHAPDVLDGVQRALDGAVRAGERVDLPRAAFEAVRGASFDVAVMERTQRAAVVAVSCGWSDVGSWRAVAALGAGARGPVQLVRSPGALAISDGPAVAVLGLPGAIVVASGGALLVSSPEEVDACGDLAPPIDVILDRGARYEVRRHFVAALDAIEIPADGSGTVVQGRFEAGGPGSLLGPGLHRAMVGSTVVVVVCSP